MPLGKGDVTTKSDYLRSTPKPILDPSAQPYRDPLKRGSDAGGDSLAAHTPAQPYVNAAMKRRVLQLIGADSKLVNLMAPEPYKSEFPFSPKVIDAALTLALDPIVKPLSLEKKLDGVPVLKKLATELTDRGYFKKYPGGGVGIGGGPGSEGAGVGDEGTSAGPGVGVAQPGPDPDEGARPGFNAETGFGARPGAGFDAMVAGPPSGGQALNAAVGGGWGSFAAAAMSALGALAGLSGVGSFGSGLGFGMNLAQTEISDTAARGGITQDAAASAISSARGAGSGGPQGGGGFQGGGSPDAVAAEMSNANPAAPPTNVPGKTPISAGTRANAAARVGGGIAPNFLEVLQSLQG